MMTPYEAGREARLRNKPKPMIKMALPALGYFPDTESDVKKVKGWLDAHYELADELSG